MAWTGLTGDDIRYSFSEPESRRFSRNIGRLVVGYDARPGVELERRLRDAVAEADDDILVVRYPTEHGRLGAAIAESGRKIYPADVLMYWEVDAAKLAEMPSDVAEGLTVAPAEDDDDSREALWAVIADSFQGYSNHYASNPELDQELALAGYIEWARGALDRGPQNVILLRHRGAPVGASTLTQSDDYVEMELAGLVSNAQGQGWYHVLLAGVGQETERRGLSRVIISTQASNIRVQRAWVRAGWKPYAAVTTVHAMKR